MSKVLLYWTFILLLILSCKPEQVQVDNNSKNPHFSPSSVCSIAKWPAISLSPINLKISPEILADFDASDFVLGLNPIEQVAKSWNDAIVGNTFFQIPMQQTASTGYHSLNSFRDTEMGIYKSYNWYGNLSPDALAITQFYGYSRSHATLGNYIELTHADIIVNYKDFANDFTSNLNFSGTFDLPTVILHEMGHFLGMCHDSINASVMRPYYFLPKRTLYQFDKTKIADLYVNNINTLATNTSNQVTLPNGTEVHGTIELMSNGKCRHFVNGLLVHEH